MDGMKKKFSTLKVLKNLLPACEQVNQYFLYELHLFAQMNEEDYS